MEDAKRNPGTNSQDGECYKSAEEDEQADQSINYNHQIITTIIATHKLNNYKMPRSSPKLRVPDQLSTGPAKLFQFLKLRVHCTNCR